MIINFMIRGISRDTYKLIRTPTLKKEITQWRKLDYMNAFSFLFILTVDATFLL
jgi:hypothetical protein